VKECCRLHNVKSFDHSVHMVMHSMLAGIAFCFKTMSDKAEQIK